MSKPIVQGSEPTLTFTLPFQCSKVTSLFITFAQKKTRYSEQSNPVFEKVLEDCSMDGDKVSVTLSEKETLSLDHRQNVEIQMRGVCDGKKFASLICEREVLRSLKSGPLPVEVKT